MAKRKRRSLPKIGRHSSGQARVKLSGKVFYLGAFGSVEAQRRYADLIQRWTDGGRKPLVETPHVEQVIPLRDLFGQFKGYPDQTGRYQKGGKATSQRGIVLSQSAHSAIGSVTCGAEGHRINAANPSRADGIGRFSAPPKDEEITYSTTLHLQGAQPGRFPQVGDEPRPQ